MLQPDPVGLRPITGAHWVSCIQSDFITIHASVAVPAYCALRFALGAGRGVGFSLQGIVRLKSTGYFS
jgi:hypothetical protein